MLFFLFQGVDQIDHGETADAAAVLLNRLDTDGGSKMGYTGAKATDQPNVLGGGIHKITLA